METENTSRDDRRKSRSKSREKSPLFDTLIQRSERLQQLEAASSESRAEKQELRDQVGQLEINRLINLNHDLMDLVRRERQSHREMVEVFQSEMRSLRNDLESQFQQDRVHSSNAIDEFQSEVSRMHHEFSQVRTELIDVRQRCVMLGADIHKLNIQPAPLTTSDAFEVDIENRLSKLQQEGTPVKRPVTENFGDVKSKVYELNPDQVRLVAESADAAVMVENSQSDDDQIRPEKVSRSRFGDTVRPEYFNPKKDTWEEYIERFGDIVKWNGWSDEQAAQYLRIRLSGEPLQFLKRQPPQVQRSWKRLTEAFKKLFEDPGVKLHSRQEFDRAQKKPEESWTEAAQRLRTLGGKAFGKKTVKETPLFETLVLSRFMDMLPDDLRRSIAMQECRTVEEAASFAMKADALSRKSTVKPNADKKGAKSRGNQKANTFTASEVSEELLQLLRDNIGIVKGLQQKQMSDSETARQRPRKQTQGANKPEAKDKSRFKCYQCGGLGHFKAECPTPSFRRKLTSNSPVPRKNEKSDKQIPNKKEDADKDQTSSEEKDQEN